VWGPQLGDLFARENYTEEMELDAQIRLTGNDIRDVKAVIIGHLHLDHAGGLEHFRGTDVPIYTHELELKHAFYSVASKTDLGRREDPWRTRQGHLEADQAITRSLSAIISSV